MHASKRSFPHQHDLAFLAPFLTSSFFASVERGLITGDIVTIAHILRYLFLNRWRALAAELRQKRYVLFACSETRFVESVFTIAKHEMGLVALISLDDLIKSGHVQGKLDFLKDFIAACERRVFPRKSEVSSAASKRNNGGLEKWVSSPPPPSLQRRQWHDEWLPGDSSPRRYLEMQAPGDASPRRYREAQPPRDSGDDFSESSMPESLSSFTQARGGGGGLGGPLGALSARPSTASPATTASTDHRLDRLESTLSTEIARIEMQIARLTTFLQEKYDMAPISPSSTSTDTVSRFPKSGTGGGGGGRWPAE